MVASKLSLAPTPKAWVASDTNPDPTRNKLGNQQGERDPLLTVYVSLAKSGICVSMAIAPITSAAITWEPAVCNMSKNKARFLGPRTGETPSWLRRADIDRASWLLRLHMRLDS